MLLGQDTSSGTNEVEGLTEEQAAALAVDRTWEIAEVVRALVGAGADVRFRAAVRCLQRAQQSIPRAHQGSDRRRITAAPSSLHAAEPHCDGICSPPFPPLFSSPAGAVRRQASGARAHPASRRVGARQLADGAGSARVRRGRVRRRRGTERGPWTARNKFTAATAAFAISNTLTFTPI
jgi:hypothetical protein